MLKHSIGLVWVLLVCQAHRKNLLIRLEPSSID